MTAARGRVLAVVPAWNEAGNLPRLLGELAARRPPPDVLVVDDGSTDGTAEVARAHGARVLRLPYNCGIGATVQAGVAWALERDYALVVRFDGDGQHDPAELDALAEPLLSGEADFVVGSRYLAREGFQSTALRRAGSRWFGLLLRLFCGLEITDPTSGSWAASRRALAVLRAELASDYPEVDSLVRLARSGCRVVERPVRMRAREAGASSIDAFRAVYYMLKVTIALLIGRVESARPGGGGGAA